MASQHAHVNGQPIGMLYLHPLSVGKGWGGGWDNPSAKHGHTPHQLKCTRTVIRLLPHTSSCPTAHEALTDHTHLTWSFTLSDALMQHLPNLYSWIFLLRIILDVELANDELQTQLPNQYPTLPLDHYHPCPVKSDPPPHPKKYTEPHHLNSLPKSPMTALSKAKSF